MDFETVVLVTADTLRYDAVADSAREEYPFLQSLADRGVEFDGAYSTGSGTSSAFPGLLASAYPLDHGYRGLNDEHVPVAERLSEAGVRTVGVTSSSHASSLFRYDRGFDVFYENPSYHPGAVDNSSLPAFERAKRGFFDAARSVPVIKQVGEAALDTLGSLRGDEADHPYERADTVTDRAIRTLEAEFDAYPNRRRFVWVHYMEPHAPYRPPDDVVAEADTEDLTKEFVNEVWEKWKADRPPLWKHDDNSDRFTERERRALEVFYRVQIRHLDREVGRLFEFLEGELDFERTALLFSSDHGEEFFDHGDLGHRPKLHDELVHVPLFAYSEAFDGRSVGETVSHVDIGPTCVDLLGGSAAERWRGISLVPLLEGEPWPGHDHVLSEVCHVSGYGGDVDPEMAVVAVTTDEWRYIRNEQTDGEALYPRDAAETEGNEMTAESGAADELRGVAARRLSEISETGVEYDELSEDLRDQLYQLGYIDE